MDLPPNEMDLFGKLRLLHDFHLAGLVTGPLIVALCLPIFSKYYFITRRSLIFEHKN